MDVPTVKDIPDVQGKRIFVRLGVNVTIEDGHIVDPFRIDEVLPTVTYLIERGAHVILAGHIGRGPNETLAPVAEYIQERIPLTFIPDIYADELTERLNAMRDGDVLLLENLRRWEGETENDEAFARHLAGLADIYVNDAFAAAHRSHASIVGVPQYLPAYLGLQFADELTHLSNVLDPEHPFLFILGGAKFATKIPLIEKFTELADTVFVGGALANAFYKQNGYEVGISYIDDEVQPERINALMHKENIQLPSDVVVETEEGTQATKPATEVLPTDAIMDAGPETVDELRPLVRDAKLILWNGPLGNYEKGYDAATINVLKLLAEHKGTTLLGGGDTATLVSRLDMKDNFTFLSTGGGAMLDYLADGELPGIAAIENAPNERCI